MIRRLTALLFVVCCVSSFLLAGVGDRVRAERGGTTIVPDTSAPDPWGYTWVRSTDPGGPTFNWVDITTRGTQVTGIGDDANVGPFSIGFPFPYYWYNANIFRIGSNGYLVLRNDGTNWSSPFSAAPPSTAASIPKDLLVALGGDLDPSNLTSNPRILYWSNAVDSFVLSFINVTEWRSPADPNQKHTFQFVLNKQDSSITYQYGRQQGRYNASNNNRLVIGWQNQSGQIGMSYTNTTVTAGGQHPLMPDSGLAIKIKRTVNTGLQITDAGVVGGLNAGNLAEIIQVSQARRIKAVIRNFGTVNLSNVRVTVSITRAGQPTFLDTVFVAAMASNEQVTVEFPRLFTPAVTGSYSARFTTTVPNDVGPGNNIADTEIVSANFALGQRTLVAYETNVQGTSTSWTGGGGFGVHYELPVPVRVDSVYVRVAAVTVATMIVEILADSAGIPGAVLATRTVNAVANTLNGISFVADSVTVPNGKFFIGARGQMAFGMETALPISFRTWEYTNGYAPYRSREVNDVIMRASVRQVALPADSVWVQFDPGPTDGNVASVNGTLYADNCDSVRITNLIFTWGTHHDPYQVPNLNWKAGRGQAVQQNFPLPPTAPGFPQDAHVFYIVYPDGTPRVLDIDPLVPGRKYLLSPDCSTTGLGETPGLPDRIMLSQNYPNPFNPSTRVSYSIPKQADVHIAVYDLLGREIAVLINEANHQAGTFEVVWNGKNRHGVTSPSGTYFIRLQSGSYTETKKLLLLK